MNEELERKRQEVIVTKFPVLSRNFPTETKKTQKKPMSVHFLICQMTFPSGVSKLKTIKQSEDEYYCILGCDGM
jgi:hypothetical protein